VLNAGIGGNRVVDDGIGPNAVARFGRDVLASNGVKYVILLEGVNDLGVLTRDKPASADQHRLMVASILAAYRQMIERAHDHGIKMIGATIMPYGTSGYYHPDAANEADRQAINSWIRSPGHFDGVIDFDALMRDPTQPSRLRKDYDSGDGLHPSAAGYRAMGAAIPLSLFSGARR
jgi:lysophospholipase L1-like esterase